MPLTDSQIQLLVQYRDKSYVSNILCEEEVSLNSFYKNLFNLPLIFSSAIMTVLNSSSFDADTMKIPNIILNSSTSLILSLIGNFKFTDKITNFHCGVHVMPYQFGPVEGLGELKKITNFQTVGRKFMKLTHSIEDIVVNNIQEADVDIVRSFIAEYDNLFEQIDFTFDSRVKNKVRNMYKDKKTLPNILNCVSEIGVPKRRNSIVEDVMTRSVSRANSSENVLSDVVITHFEK